MSVILLPVDAVNCAFEAGTASGSDVAKWTSPTKNSLGDLVTDLSEFKEKVDVTSIPDIWAGPKAFEAQLIDDVEEQRVKWRAVLAIIGLRKVMRFNLKIKSIKIPKVGSTVYNNRNTHPFLKVVSRLMDKEFNGYPGGDTIHLICSGNTTIAMVWPNSIIYPISGVGVSAPWWDGAKYYDPSQSKALAEQEAGEDGEDSVVSAFLSEKQSYILAKWLKKLRNKIALSNISTAKELSECIISYIQDLGYNINDLPDEDNAEELIFTEEDKEFEIVGYGSMLSQVYSTPASKEDLDLSQIRLDSRDNSKHVLVIDEAIAVQWKMQTSNIVCFGTTDLGSALDMIRDDAKKRQFLEESKLANYNAELWTINDFFTDKIVYITGFAVDARPFPNSLTEKDEYKGKFCFDFGKNNLQEFVLPIRREVLDYILPEDLVKSISIKRDTSNGPVTVTLTIELSGGTKPVELIKVYEETDIIKRTSLPNVQIWPNFQADCWKQYYVFSSVPSNSDTIMVPAWSNENVENLNFDIKADKRIKVKLRRGSEFPSSFVYRTIEKEKSEQVGLICLRMDEKALKEPAAGDENIYIGVDFGTTNSVVYYTNILDSGDDAAKVLRKQLPFMNRIYEVTKAGDFEKADLRRYFFPANDQPEIVPGVSTNSIRTIFHEFNLEDKDQVENMEQPLVRGNIYYLENGQSISDDLVVINELKGNIKWDNGIQAAANVNRMHAFIYQLCLQAMAEAVMKGAKEITWQYSWPSAYDSDKVKNLATFWTTNLIKAMNDIADVSDSERVYQKTESLSMVDYFQTGDDKIDAGLVHSKGILSIDIGGGSTDVAIWKGTNKHDDSLHKVDQCSFKMAGTDIFANYIRNKYKKYPKLLTPLSGGNKDLEAKLNKLTELALLAEKEPAVWNTFELELESVLKYSEEALINGMGVADFAGRGFQELNSVMRDIAFALGGIFYYSGSVIGYYRKNDSNCPITEGLPDCFVGGNGSKLLDWASKGKFANADKLKFFLRDCIVWGMLDTMQKTGSELKGFDINASISRSPKPKHEVSKGLVSGYGKDPNEEDFEGFDIDPNEAFGNITDSDNGFGEITGGLNSLTTDNIATEANKRKVRNTYVVSGELYYINGSNDSSDAEKISTDNFTDSNKHIAIDFRSTKNRFIRYCIVFNHEIGKYHLFNGKNIVFVANRSGNDLNNIFNKVTNELKSRETKTGKGVIVEPLFIMELREAMKTLSNY